MEYTLVANSADPDQVEEQTIDGDRHLVAKDVTFIRPMQLAGGYVPEQAVANSTPAWDGRPLTINHPKNLPDRPWYDPDYGSFYVLTDADEEIRRRKVVGHAENPSRRSDGSVAADLAINVDRVEEIAERDAVSKEDSDAAEALLDALEDGQPFNVSSQYTPQPLPPGEYDGEFRGQVEAIGNADSIALLPEKNGVCSLEDGCGFKPPKATANSEIVRALVAPAENRDDPAGASSSGRDDEQMTSNATNYSLTEVSPDDVDEWTDDEWDGSDVIADLPNPSEDDDAADVLDATHAVHPTGDEARESKSSWKLPFRAGPDAAVNTRALIAIDAVLSGGRGGVEGLGDNVRSDVTEWTQAMLEAAPDDLFGSTQDGEMTSNSLLELGRHVAARLGLVNSADGTIGAESPVDGSDPGDPGEDTMTDRQELIKEITANSEIEEESLEGMGDQCLQSTHDHVVGNEAGGETDEEEETETETETTTDGQTIGDMTVDELGSALASQGFVTEGDLGEAVANAQEQTEKEERAERIVANSNEYEESDVEWLSELPDAELDRKERAVGSSTGLPGATGTAERATANAADGVGDLDEYPDGTVDGRAD